MSTICCRRDLLAGLGAVAAAPSSALAQAAGPIRIVGQGLKFPEGPVALSDGSTLLVEIQRGTLSRVWPDGRVTVVADLGGGPNGTAIGPDGAAYVANDGGLVFTTLPDGRLTPTGVPADYRSGSIQRVDLTTGASRTLYTGAGGHPLKGPNDLVFDAWGGFWFTDTGKARPRDRDFGGVYWASPDGSEIREVIYPLLSPNGIALSPDRRTLYVALSDQREIVSYAITGRGTLQSNAAGQPAQTLVAAIGGKLIFDSMCVEAGGNIVVGAVLAGALIVISPTGEVVDKVTFPDSSVTNAAFGGADLRTLYVTLSSTGQLAAMQWPRPGLKLLYR